MKLTDKEIFKAELDRLKQETSIGLSEWENGVEHGRMEIINSLYKTLDSMQENIDSINVREKMDVPNIHILSDGIEEAAKEYAGHSSIDKAEGFLAGAKWQLQQFEKDCNDLYRGVISAKGFAISMAYEKGKADMRNEIMADAVSGHIFPKDGDILVESETLMKYKFEEYDEVKVVIKKNN